MNITSWPQATQVIKCYIDFSKPTINFDIGTGVGSPTKALLAFMGVARNSRGQQKPHLILSYKAPSYDIAPSTTLGTSYGHKLSEGSCGSRAPIGKTGREPKNVCPDLSGMLCDVSKFSGTRR